MNVLKIGKSPDPYHNPLGVVTDFLLVIGFAVIFPPLGSLTSDWSIQIVQNVHAFCDRFFFTPHNASAALKIVNENRLRVFTI